MLIDMITSAQDNSDDMMELINQFMPLIKKYGRMLHTEDAKSDLILEFIELIKKVRRERFRCLDDGTVVTYIEHSMRNSYYKLLKKYFATSRQIVSLEDITEKERMDVLSEEVEVFAHIFDAFPKHLLTDKERQIIVLIFENGCTSAQIARIWGCSRQAVNQAKRSALNKMKRCLTKDSR
jgi:RNA polymerase sigma factor (sigma-70 family)